MDVVPSEVVGWRAWRLVTVEGSPRLRSLYHDIVWPTDDWLVTDNDHGICAAFDVDHLQEMHRWGDARSPKYVADGGVIGRVGLSGWIREGERGYRAEKARVVSLVLPYVKWELLVGLRDAYRVPVSLGNTLHHGEMSWT